MAGNYFPFSAFYYVRWILREQNDGLIHCGLLTQYGIVDSGQHRYQAINRSAFDLLSLWYVEIYFDAFIVLQL